MSSQSARSDCIRGALRAWWEMEGSLDSGRDTRSVEASSKIGTSAMRSKAS